MLGVYNDSEFASDGDENGTDGNGTDSEYEPLPEADFQFLSQDGKYKMMANDVEKLFL